MLNDRFVVKKVQRHPINISDSLKDLITNNTYSVTMHAQYIRVITQIKEIGDLLFLHFPRVISLLRLAIRDH
jgi:hypothetical protein